MRNYISGALCDLLSLVIGLDPPHAHAGTPPTAAQRERQRDDDQSQYGLEDQGAEHVPRGQLGAVVSGAVADAAGAQGVGDEDEDAASELAAGPADGAGDLGGRGVGDLNEVFEHHGDEAEGGGAHDGEDGVDGADGARARRPCKSQVADGDDGDLELDGEEVGLGAVNDGRCHGCRDEPDDDEQRACDAGLGFGEGVGGEDLVDER